MKFRVFTTNADGKIEFTKDELEKLLNEVYEDGKNVISGCPWAGISSVMPINEVGKTISTTSDKTLEIKY